MLLRSPPALLVLLWLGVPPDAAAKSAEVARVEEIRALFQKIEAMSKTPAPVNKQNQEEGATWSQLQAWELKAGKGPKLRKILVTRTDGSGTLERSFFFQGESLFFAYYVTTPPGSGAEPQKKEERLYFARNGDLIRWQHDQVRKPLDGHAWRWGAQAQSDAKVAKALASGKDLKERFEPLTCIISESDCQPGADCMRHFVIFVSLFTPPGVPGHRKLCSTSPWFAGYSHECSSVEVKGRELIVTQSGEQECPDSEEDENAGCEPRFSEQKKIPLSPEMGRVVECKTPEKQEEEEGEE